MKKRLLSLVLTSAMAMSIAACAPKKTDAGSATPATNAEGKMEDPAAEISVQAEGPWKSYYEEVVKTIQTKYPKSKITIKEVASFPNLDTIDKTDATNADVADVFALPADRLSGLNKKEALAPMPAEEMAKAVGGFKDFNKGLGGNFKIGNDYLAFPMNIETLVTFFNPVNAKAMNIDTTKPFDFKDNKDKELMVMAHDAWFGIAIANSAGINLLSKDASGNLATDMTKDWKDLGADKQAVFNELYNYWKTTNVADGASLWDKDAAGGFIDKQFADGGKAVYRIDGPWATVGFQKLAPNTDIKNLDAITINGKPLKHWKGGWGLGINSRIQADKNKMMLAQELIKEIVNPKNAEKFYKATGKIMENVTVDEYQKSSLSDMDKKVIKAVIESYDKAEARPLFDEWGQVWPSWQNAILSWNTKKPANGEEAYKLVQDSFKTMMSNFKK